MDDAWLHSFTAPPVAKESPAPRRRPSLLEQPTEEKTATAIQTISEFPEDDSPWRGPPKATLARRAQSYSDFYHVVTSYSKKEQALERRKSLSGKAETRAETDAELEFDADFASLEDALLEESHGKYQTYHEQLQLSNAHMDNLLASTSNTLSLLATLSGSFEAVETQTDAFRQQCETLISEQRRLGSLADAVDENATYYSYLEPITRRLNAPGAANLVKGHDFPEMLSHLDNCLEYMESHPNHKESATYRSRYRLLLTRGLTLIRHHFTKSLGEIGADISKRIQGGQLKESTHSALLYAKFRVPAPALKDMGIEIQKRAVPTPDDVDAGREPEYASLMRELYQSYSATRGRLILPLVSKKMAELGSTTQQSDVLTFAKAAFSFMRGICLDEHELWFEWFERDGALYDFLESLMEPLYDYLRPRIIHETKLEKLCELCSTIQGRYMELDSEDEEDDDSESGGLSPTPTRKGPYGRKLDFAGLIQPGLEDAQTRLVFLALATLRDGIENYRPKPEDLDWANQGVNAGANGGKSGPALSGKRGSVSTTQEADAQADEADSIIRNDTSGAQRWYPTLPKAIWLLRRIYRLVNSTVFDDLAHRIVHSTIASLLTASTLIRQDKTKDTTYSPSSTSQLFLITHLLHLKHQILAFDIEFIPPDVELDFSSVTTPFHALRAAGGSLWNPTSWARLVGSALTTGSLLPKVVENMLDAKAELDVRLRSVINDFVGEVANDITAPLDSGALKKTTDKEPFDGLKAVRTVRGLAESRLPGLRAQLGASIPDARTRETLLAAIRDQVVLSYEDFAEEQWVANGGQGRKPSGSRKGKGKEGDMWDAEVFAEVMEGVFGVGRVLGDDDEFDDGGSDK